MGPRVGVRRCEWLRRWLESRLSLRASTARSYAAHVRGYLVPYLGGIPLAVLTSAATVRPHLRRRPVAGCLTTSREPPFRSRTAHFD
jgi:hypothetical protein